MATEPITNPLDAKIAEARADEAYLSRHHPRHAESVANAARLYQQRFPEPVAKAQPPAPHESDAKPELRDGDVQPGLPSTEDAHRELWEEMSVGDLRSRAGVHVDLPKGYEFDEVREAQYLAYVVENAIPAQTAQHVLSWYADKMILSMGEVGDADYDEFRETFKGSLTPAQIELLVRWHKIEVMGGKAAPQTKHWRVL